MITYKNGNNVKKYLQLHLNTAFSQYKYIKVDTG